MSKICFKCDTAKDLSEFYKHKGMKDGYLNKCKICTKKDTDDYSVKNTDKANGYKRKWANKNKKAKIEANKKYREHNPLKYYAHGVVSYAISIGNLVTPCECSECSCTDRLHAHHDDYNKPLDVRWLCNICHKDWHRNNTPIT